MTAIYGNRNKLIHQFRERMREATGGQESQKGHVYNLLRYAGLPSFFFEIKKSCMLAMDKLLRQMNFKVTYLTFRSLDFHICKMVQY